MSKKVSEVKKITAKNFFQAVDYTVDINRKVTCHLRTRSIALPIGCTLFLLLSAVLTFGYISDVDIYGAVITEKIPFVSNLWDKIVSLLNNISTVWYWKTLICLVLLYLIPFAVSSVLAVLIRLFTKVKTPSMDGDHVKQVNSLYEYCSKIPCAKKHDWKFNVICCRITAICFVLMLLSFEVYAFTQVEIYLLFVYLAIPLYFVFNLMCKLFALMLKPYYIARYYVNTSVGSREVNYIYIISEYRKKVDPVIRARFEELERIEKAKREKEEREKKEIQGKIAEAYLNGWRPKDNTPQEESIIQKDPMGYGDGVYPINGIGRGI